MLLLIPLAAAAVLLYWLFKPPAPEEEALPLEHPGPVAVAGQSAEDLPAVVTVHAAAPAKPSSVE